MQIKGGEGIANVPEFAYCIVTASFSTNTLGTSPALLCYNCK